MKCTQLALVSMFAVLLIVLADQCPRKSSLVVTSAASLAEAKRLQLRLAFGNRPNSMIISWNSPNTSFPGLVQVRLCSDADSQSMRIFQGTTNEAQRKDILCEVFKPSTRYHYSVRVEPHAWSGWMSFRTAPSSADANYSFALIGDLGVTFGSPVSRAIASAVEVFGSQRPFKNFTKAWENWLADDPETMWLQQELMNALQMKRNQSINWLFTFVHYPKQPFGYCTYNLPFCSATPTSTQEWFEDLFAAHEVDIHFTAHQHVYERTFPVYRQRPVFPNASLPSPHPGMFPAGIHDVFDDPVFPMHLVNGAAGDDVIFPQNWLPPPAWSVVNSRTVQFGFTVVEASPERVNVSYRVPLEAEPGVQKVFTMDEFSITKTRQGQRKKSTSLRSLVPSIPLPSLMV